MTSWRATENLRLAEGDLIAIMSAGAYGMTMTSNYNTRPRAAEVMVSGGDMHLIRERETMAQLIRDGTFVTVIRLLKLSKFHRLVDSIRAER